MEHQLFDDMDIAPREVEFKLGGVQHVLKEASADAARRYRNTAVKAAKMSDGKVTGLDGVADVEPLLVSLCLFKREEKGDKPIKLDDVLKMPSRVTKRMFERAKEISDLDEGADEESLRKQIAALQQQLDKVVAAKETVKNGQSGATTSSEPHLG